MSPVCSVTLADFSGQEGHRLCTGWLGAVSSQSRSPQWITWNSQVHFCWKASLISDRYEEPPGSNPSHTSRTGSLHWVIYRSKYIDRICPSRGDFVPKFPCQICQIWMAVWISDITWQNPEKVVYSGTWSFHIPVLYHESYFKFLPTSLCIGVCKPLIRRGSDERTLALLERYRNPQIAVSFVLRWQDPKPSMFSDPKRSIAHNLSWEGAADLAGSGDCWEEALWCAGDILWVLRPIFW